MTLLRRLAVGLLLALAGHATAIAAALPADVIRVAPGILLVKGRFPPGRQPDGNSVIVAGRHGDVLIDTGRHADHVATIEAALRTAQGPLVAIVNTHWHLDHVSGNLPLRQAHPGVPVYASDAIDGALGGFLKHSAEDMRAALAAPGLDPAQREDMTGDLATIGRGAALRPDHVVADGEILAASGRRLVLHVARAAATAGDVWIYEPSAKVVVAGDLVTLPAPFLDTACPQGWKAALRRIAATPFRLLIPGHGAPMDRREFEGYRRAFTIFVDCAEDSGQAVVDCATHWRSAAGALVPAADAHLADALAGYYAGLIRRGALTRNCAGARA